jgi:hypothetical protein
VAHRRFTAFGNVIALLALELEQFEMLKRAFVVLQGPTKRL